MKQIPIILLIALSLSVSLSNAQTINTDKSVVTFEISAMGVFDVEGKLTGLQGDFNFDKSDLETANFDICVDAKTINTDNEKRDIHLRSDDFFAVETYPTICYKSSSVTKTETGYETSGDLTIHGVTKSVMIPFTFKNNTFQGELEINRFDYNLGEDYGTFRVGETATVKITCQVN